MLRPLPFCRTRFRGGLAPLLCCVPEETSPLRLAAFYNAHPLNLIRRLRPGGVFPTESDLLPLLQRDRTPGFYLCETALPGARFLALAARLRAEPPASLLLRPAELLCTDLPAPQSRHVPGAAQILSNLAASTPAAVSFVCGEAHYTLWPVHDPLALETLAGAFAGCTLRPLWDEAPPERGAVLLYVEPPAGRFAAGLLLDGPDGPEFGPQKGETAQP